MEFDMTLALIEQKHTARNYGAAGGRTTGGGSRFAGSYPGEHYEPLVLCLQHIRALQDTDGDGFVGAAALA